jgi:hypothetical protein
MATSQAASVQGGTARRSARLSTVARSIGSQSIVTATPGASATPTRRRGPLAKVKARQSTAYGASGRLGAAEELTVPVTGFVQAFQSQRIAAVSRVDEALTNGGFNGASVPRTSTPNGETATPSLRGESEDPPSDDEQEDSGANTSKSFGMLREAGMLRALTPPGHPPHTGNSAKAVPAVRPAQQQHEVSLNHHTAARPAVGVAPRRLSPVPVQNPVDDVDVDHDQRRNWKQYLLWAVVVLLSVLAISSPFSGRLNVKPRIASGLTNMAEWISPSGSDVGQAHLRTLISKQGLGLKDLQDAFHGLRKEMPDKFAAKRNSDGTWHLDEDFWVAIVNKFQTDGPSPDWDAFLQKNEERVQRLFEQGLDRQETKSQILLREELFAAMDASYSNISADFDKKVAKMTQSLMQEASKIAAKEAKKVSIDEGRLHSLAQSRLLTNTELGLQKVNYFSPGLGAKIDSSITSATFVDNSAMLARLGRRLMLLPERRPPSAALESWEEPGDCWCSAPDDSKKGKAQLGIQLSTPMFPKQLTIEHIPMAVIPEGDVSSAPREVEVWVESYEPAMPRFGLDGSHCEAGPPGYICLGKVHYDIRGSNHVQTFLLDAESQTPISNVMLRVTNNWGADHTCIYRVRLHGKDWRPVHEYRFQDD